MVTQGGGERLGRGGTRRVGKCHLCLQLEERALGSRKKCGGGGAVGSRLQLCCEPVPACLPACQKAGAVGCLPTGNPEGGQGAVESASSSVGL